MKLKRSTLVFITLITQTLIIAGMIHLQSYDVAKTLVCGFLFADICGALALGYRGFLEWTKPKH